MRKKQHVCSTASHQVGSLYRLSSCDFPPQIHLWSNWKIDLLSVLREFLWINPFPLEPLSPVYLYYPLSVEIFLTELNSSVGVSCSFIAGFLLLSFRAQDRPTAGKLSSAPEPPAQSFALLLFCHANCGTKKLSFLLSPLLNVLSICRSAQKSFFQLFPPWQVLIPSFCSSLPSLRVKNFH